MVTETIGTDEGYDLAISAGTLLLATELAALEYNPDRKRKKQRIELLKLDGLRASLPDLARRLEVPADARILVERSWTREDAVSFLIDLAFIDPFDPYVLAFREKDFRTALESVARLVGVEGDTVRRMLATKKSALRAHWRFNWVYLFVTSLLRTLAIGLGIFFAAPLIGSFLSSGFGFLGITVANHGLAFIHAGAIDPMTAGVMGGRLFATGVGNLSKSLAGGTDTFLYKVGSARARLELGRLQVNFREVLLAGRAHVDLAGETIERLRRDRDETREKLWEEREMNERSSGRVKDIEQTMKAINSAIKWMQRELARASA
jgi:hypothetical protein